MPKTFYEAILGIEVPDEFGCYSESEGLTPATDEYVNKVFDLAKEFNIELDYAYGVSQLCFIVKGAKEVIKVGFNGMMDEWDDYDYENEESNWKEEFNSFDFDYCSKAYEIYNSAYEEGLEMFFAEYKVLGVTFTKDTIWTQTFVTPVSKGSESSRKASEDSLKKAESMSNEKYIPFNNDWLALAIDLYGERKVERLLAFLEDGEIHDFHSGNYGYDLEGFPKLLDYSSWC